MPIVIIPPEQVNIDSLRSIVESVIVRDGTDYGERELSLEEKVDILLPQVLRSEVLISFDEDTETITLIPKQDANNLS